MNRPIIIIGCHKSGTSLLRNLFDGHPYLFAIPFETHVFVWLSYWISYYSWSTKPKQLDYDHFKDNFYHWIEHLNNNNDRYGDSFVQGKFNLKSLKQKLNYFRKDLNLSEFMKEIVSTIYFSLYGKDISPNIDFVEKSIENAEVALDWKKIFPNARFIHIVRNPYSNLISIKNYLRKKGHVKLRLAIENMYNSFYHLYKNQRLIDNYKIVRYEDLVIEPEKTIKDLCGCLNLEYFESLLKPTLNGQSWFGNSTTDNKFNEISDSLLNRWKSEISSFEISLVNSIYDFVLKDFCYEKLPVSKSIYFPAKGENFKNYIYNRIYNKFKPIFKIS